ncbi:hypothetical protein SERLADRAFT_463426 [Serpula lacrymans var. lacrymans S7.9]|nr:uncharacterized protein SERLADRAFT_463426 [Serpula lacrymans var. lacrymans S7.9]EGO26397.1 hypothetical protein SERLADRAFT_463426 [Serpula lacrymans var. lacrymans S7.9]
MVCTTSRDFTARIYDLTQSPDQGINHIPGSHKATDRLYGAPHGLRMVESEGKGIGRCTVVLMGSESGGHASSVLGAAFHPSLPLIATCGLDHAVKIWRLPLSVDEKQHREDRPVFSSSRIHKSRVLSVAWLDQDILLTHSAPVLVREEIGESVEFHYEDGIMAVWCWLGLDRYLPPGQPWSEKSVPGCKSDYRDSFSFKMLASASLPQETRDLRVYRMPTRDPLVIISLPSSIRLVNVIHLPKRKVQPFPLDKDVLAEATARQLDDGEEDEVVSVMGAQNSKPAMVEGWEIRVPNFTLESPQQVQHSIMGLNGSLLVAAGSKGTVWFWQTK